MFAHTSNNNKIKLLGVKSKTVNINFEQKLKIQEINQSTTLVSITQVVEIVDEELQEYLVRSGN